MHSLQMIIVRNEEAYQKWAVRNQNQKPPKGDNPGDRKDHDNRTRGRRVDYSRDIPALPVI